jgi:hypothetical protein
MRCSATASWVQGASYAAALVMRCRRMLLLVWAVQVWRSLVATAAEQRELAYREGVLVAARADRQHAAVLAGDCPGRRLGRLAARGIAGPAQPEVPGCPRPRHPFITF